MIREERKKQNRLRSFLQKLGILAALTLIFTVLLMKVFVIEDVEVVGNKLYGQDVIVSAVLNDEYSWNSLYVFMKYRFKDTEEIPFVDTMEITLKSSHKLGIHVYEKGMMGYLYISGIGENAYFDKDGFVVETSSDVIADVPKIEGITCDEVVLYEKLPIEEDKLRELLTLTQTLKRSELIPDSIAYGEEHEPVLTYGNIRILVGSTSSFTQKVERIVKILPALEGKKGTLHLESWTEDTTNIVFQEE